MSLWLRKLDPAETSDDEQLDQVVFIGHMAEHTRRDYYQFVWDLLLANIQRVCQKMDLVNQENHHDDLADMASARQHLDCLLRVLQVWLTWRRGVCITDLSAVDGFLDAVVTSCRGSYSPTLQIVLVDLINFGHDPQLAQPLVSKIVSCFSDQHASLVFGARLALLGDQGRELLGSLDTLCETFAKDASNHNSLLLYRAHVAKATTTFLPELVVEEKTLQ